jgi:hypothetical protein
MIWERHYSQAPCWQPSGLRTQIPYTINTPATVFVLARAGFVHCCILSRHVRWKMEWFDQKRRPLLGNGSVNTFPREWIRVRQWRNCWRLGKASGTQWWPYAARVAVVKSYETVGRRSEREHRSWIIWLLGAVARQRLVELQKTILRAIAICRLCRLVTAL